MRLRGRKNDDIFPREAKWLKSEKKNDPKIQTDLGAIMFNILEGLLKVGYLQ